VLAVPVTVALPYLLRRGAVGRGVSASPKAGVSFRQRMRPHFWIGYAIVTLSAFHALIAMTGGITGLINPLGLSLAFIGLFVVVFQLALGSLLARPDLPERRTLRTLHFWTMCSLVVLGFGHILLNSPTLAHFIK
jgi:hypothetical protein